MSLDTLAPLSVPVPPMLEQALGYNGSAGLVAFYWATSGDEVLFDDGVVSAEAEQASYLGLLEHPTIASLDRKPATWATTSRTHGNGCCWIGKRMSCMRCPRERRQRCCMTSGRPFPMRSRNLSHRTKALRS